MCRYFLLLSLLFPLAIAVAQSTPVQDNSFLVEEGYNQEPGVVQHINTFTLIDGSWLHTFTQEWPVPKHARHQLSYTIGATSAAEASGYGFSDTLLNYRYQLIGSGSTRIAFAPRISLLIPTGSSRWGRGFGGPGVQVNLPASVVLTRTLVSHWNLGATLVPNAADRNGDHAPIHAYNAAQSLVWLIRPRFNLLLETAYYGNEIVTGPHSTSGSKDLYVSPGIRWAHNLSHGLQIVPGIGVPMGAGPSSGKSGIILYLSLERRMWRESEK